ncbi:hypothetical protein A2438_01255 [candidate division WOR-1 bacterium RIFOXYC2_FULL_46_14]|uniref:SLH domain-containing protein n=1 Tax=candidate division WOR-1 bacterium RIFOXYC2_FULL_46_14 TaxID=1802587 RepID=A0A1F4U7H0_UNCSA|nr:MAG: hypothetical protein A2438_01255 [candidate division WOR-1 bacterium RIFOXYC2_FULL_46_14]
MHIRGIIPFSAYLDKRLKSAYIMEVMIKMRIWLLVIGYWLLATGFSMAATTEASAIKFKDVPDKSWAAGSVYTLVKLGITQGFPDGTFRGKQKISRYELASFLTKLIEATGGVEQKNIKADLDSIKEQLATMKKSSQIPVSGSVESVLRYGNLMVNDLNSHGPVASYRVIASMMNDLGAGTSLKFNLDTMDAGYYNGGSDIINRLLDIQAKTSVNPANIGLSELGFRDPMDVLLTIGPGPQQHTDGTGLLPSETGIVYERPYTGVDLQTGFFGTRVKGGYFAAAKSLTGKITSNRFRGMVGYTVPDRNIDLSAQGDYYIDGTGPVKTRDLRGVFSASAPISSKVKMDAQVGIAKGGRSGMMAGAKVYLDDPFNTKTKVTLSGSKIGGDYLALASQFDYAGLDFFDRALENATVNLGGELVQGINDKWSLKGKGDVRMSSDFGYGKDKAKSRATAQVGLTYNIAPQADFDTYYRLQQDPVIGQTSDFAAAGLLYRF